MAVRPQHMQSHGDINGNGIGRLTRIAGTDPGFYVLGLHAFIEAYARQCCPWVDTFESFPYLITELIEALKDSRGGPLPLNQFNAMRAVRKEHELTNSVRHYFAPLGVEQARAATYNFLRFCDVVGISDGGELQALRASLDTWNERESPADRATELHRIQTELQQAQRENKRLLEQAEELERDRAQLERVGSELHQLRAQQAAADGARLGQRSQTQLTNRISALEGERRQLQEHLSALEEVANYVARLDEATHYARTRLDYERSVTRLTPEQQDVLDAIALDHDFLIKGGAGTGKTLVLLEALRKALVQQHEELELRPGRRNLLLTYTTTLVKYDGYLSQLMGLGTTNEIRTADSFFLEEAQRIDSRYRVCYGEEAESLYAECNTTGFLSDALFMAELENLVFAVDVSEDEYVVEGVLRRGMSRRLTVRQRQAVWSAKEKMVEQMEETGILTKGYSRVRILRELERDADPATSDVDYVFLDESQDLLAVELAILKRLATRAVVMAGDIDQSIYGLGSPYKRAGINISGRTRLLKTNFRNTVPIHELAERYRAKSSRRDPDITPRAFREGPIPELYRAAKPAELERLLIRKLRMFTGRIGYAPENIAILAPSNAALDSVAKRLDEAGFQHDRINKRAFTFQTEGVVRMSTMHSAKGLDFPVVLLFVPSLWSAPDYTPDHVEAIQRNLLYVAMTRAMDNLSIFTLQQPKEQALRELASEYDSLLSRGLLRA